MDVAAALRAARRSAGVSQRVLARRAGLSPGALSRYETGAALPSLPALDRVLTACGKDLRLVLIDRVDDLDTELARGAAVPWSRRHPPDDFLRRWFLERLVERDTQVLVGGAWAADLHGIPCEAAEGRLLVPDDPAVRQRLAAAFMSATVPLRELDGHFGSLPVRPSTFEEPVVRWQQRDVGRFLTELVGPDGPWPDERRLSTPAGPLRVVAPHTLGESDGVLPEVLAAWTAWRTARGPDVAGWAGP